MGPLREVRAAHPTFRCLRLATTTALRRNLSAQARAWRPSSCKQGAKAAGTAAAAWRAGDADRTKPRNRLPVREARDQDQENPRQIVGAMAATAGADCACLSVKSKPQRCGGHCLAKRMHGKSATMVLMLAGARPGVRLLDTRDRPHACAVAQRNNARPWTTVKSPVGAAVATLKRMQWTILEHDPFLRCLHDGSIVDPRRVCPHSMHTLLKKAARVWQW